MFERLVALRLAEERLDEADAVDAVIRDKQFGSEIDPRCTQIGAFNLALAAWRRMGHRALPAMNLACSGLAPNTREADWLAIAGDEEQLRNGMERLYRLFKNAPVLGSLINPRAAEGDLLEAGFLDMMRGLPATIYTGEKFSADLSIIDPIDQSHLAALWVYCTSEDYFQELRKIDQALRVTNTAMVKIPFDLAHWQKVAAEKYPHGLPKPFSSDPTQWLFNGHPNGRAGILPAIHRGRDARAPLHVAVARLLGYQWPRQTGSSFPDCPALGPDGLEALADADGIVPISPAKGEGPATERLRELLVRAYGPDWNAARQEELLAQVGYAGASLEDWLRNGFFEQHCALFHHRPFIWQVWDGLKNGFSALVNYHKLSHANLEKLTYSTLGNWIQRQQAGVAAGEAGSDAKLQAARQLQAKLILEGEPPYDIFVRWKPLAQQASGWQPDLNDGVRINIRPFAAADILRKRVKIKWDKDRGKEPMRSKAEFPWFWGWDEARQDFAGVGQEPDGNRWNNCRYSLAAKQAAKASQAARK